MIAICGGPAVGALVIVEVALDRRSTNWMSILNLGLWDARLAPSGLAQP